MRRGRGLVPWAMVLGVAATAVLQAGQTLPSSPVFRSISTLVSLNVSVKRDGRVVTGLTPADFTVIDNGVPQNVRRLSYEEIPVDTTVIVDVSGSTRDAWQRIRRDAERIVGFLRPIDRIRILAIDTYVHEVIPMQPAGGVKLPAQTEVGGVSPVRDAISAALIGRSDPERRRLIVALTDALDTKSITEASMLLEVARRSDSVLHVVAVPFAMPQTFGRSSGPPPKPMTLAFFREAPTKAEQNLLDQAATVTGGATHGFTPRDASDDAVRVFQNVFNDFKQSYLVQYNAENVAERGWHEVDVRVKGVDQAGVRARKGYFGAR